MKTFFNNLQYSKINPLTLLLWPFSILYAIAVSIRNFLYDNNILKSTKLQTTVISIGNLTTGGTGKTPVTAEIANYLTSRNKKAAIISRGYGGRLSIKKTNIISDGEKIYYNAEMAGDEPYWLAKNCPGTIVITGKNRIKSGIVAIDNFNADILILDDGFQHRKLKRDLDIVLIDSNNMFGNGFLLPAGPLREPVSQIRRADKIIMTDKSSKALVCAFSGEQIPGVKKALAFSAIARPESFFNLLKEQGIDIVYKSVFSDHYMYNKRDIEILFAKAEELQADVIITTEKDMVKIEQFLDDINTNVPISALKLKTAVDTENITKGLL